MRRRSGALIADVGTGRRRVGAGLRTCTARQSAPYAREGRNPFALARAHCSALLAENEAHENTCRLFPPALEFRLPTSTAPAVEAGPAVAGGLHRRADAQR